MSVRKPPDSWFWSHDIESDQIDSLLMPGMHLMRLSSYGSGPKRRFAALLFKEAGADHSYLLDVAPDQLTTQIGVSGARPVALTAEMLDDDVRFSLVLAKGPGSLTSLHTDLDEAALRALADGQHSIIDLAVYSVGGARKFAAIVEEHAAESWVLTGVSAHELDAKLLELGGTLVRLRPYSDGGQRRFAAVIDKSNVGRWAWYTDLDGDTVAKHLSESDAYPFDLEATKDERGQPRFTVVMYRDRAST
jgi:hypothetical protein